MKKGWVFLCAMAFAVTAWAGDFSVLILNGDARNQEIPVLMGLTSTGGHTFSYEEVLIEGASFDGDTRGADIIWFPWNGPGHDGAYFMEGSEQAVLDFVQGGGAVWISGFDDNYVDTNGNQVGGWFPIDEHPVVVQNTGDSDVEVTAEGEASGLFSNPNAYDLNDATLDDNFADLDDSFVILANRVDNASPAVCYLTHGNGIYLEACIDTRDAGRTDAVAPFMENALVFLGDWLGNTTAVDPAGKAATTWGVLKAE